MRTRTAFALAPVLIAVLLAGCPEDKEKALAAAKIAHDLGQNHLAQSTRQNLSEIERKQNIQKALENYLKAVRDDPDFAEAHNALGLIYLTAYRDFDKAEHHLTRAVELKKDFSDAYNNLGLVYIEKGQYDKAIAMFKKTLGDMLYASPQNVFVNIGWAYYKAGDVKEAIESFKKAIALDPKFCLGHLRMGVVFLERGEGLEAVRALGKYREACPSSPEAHYLLAVASHKFKLAKLEEVTALLDRALELNPAYCPALLMLGQLHDELMKYREGAAFLEKYFDSCPETAEAYQQLGTIYFKLGQDQRAAAYLETCARKFPDTMAGQTCRELGRKYQQK